MPGPFYFAWTGGTVQEPIRLVTTGSVHGSGVATFSAVGDLNPASGQLENLATASGLESGELYLLSGPGVAPGTFFIYDSGTRINLSPAPTQALQSVTLTITKPTTIGNLVGRLTRGSSTVSLGDVPDLVPGGVYGIGGTGIGQILVPPPTTSGTTETTGGGDSVQIVGSAFFRYAGSGDVSLRRLIAVADTRTGISQEGVATNILTYSVREVEVTAIASGDFPLVITGPEASDPETITTIPASALASLTPGLRYNIAGPGLQVGTTFVAPSAGADAVAIDVPATASGIGVVLQITGPRVPTEPFDVAKHARFDEDVLSVEVDQAEGGFAGLKVDVRNPMVGLLAPGRHLWCWLSWDANWTPDGTSAPDIRPLFNGRLVGVPKRQAGEVVQLEFLARPDDYNAQKLALAEAMRVLPFWDPVWLVTNPNPDTVLETYSALWHIDRLSLDVSASDILVGEDGTVAIPESLHFYDVFSLSYGQPPLNAVTVTGTVSWQQQADGTLDVTQPVADAFKSTGSAFSNGVFSGFSASLRPSGTVHRSYISGGALISCLCGEGLKNDWPKPGTNIGGGWSLSPGNDASGVPLNYIISAVKSNDGGWLKPQVLQFVLAGEGPPGGGEGDPSSGSTNATEASNVNQFFHPFGKIEVSFPLNVYKTRMCLDYRANRKRTETVTAVIAADVQQVLSDPAGADTQAVAFTSEFVGEAIEPGGGIPIGNLGRATYFQTDRGAASFEYLVLAARAKLRFRARAVDVHFAIPWADALGLTLRNSVTLYDRRLPGGSATGKIKAYRLIAGEGGMWGEFTIGCSIGRGAIDTGAAGTNCYAADGYMAAGYQMITGGNVLLIAEEIGYQSLTDFAVADDGVDLLNVTVENALEECVVTNGLSTQVKALQPFHGTVGASPLSDAMGTMRTLSTQCTLAMKPLQGSEFHTQFFPAVTPLALPKTIDLEAQG